MPPRSAPATALLGKRWDLLAEYKDRYWRQRKRLGAGEALRVVDSLRAQAQYFHPNWPTPEEREADFQTHRRVSAALARTASACSGTRNRSVPAPARPAGVARSGRRVRTAR